MDFQHIIQPQFESMHGAAQFMVSACFYQIFGFSGLRTRADTNVTSTRRRQHTFGLFWSLYIDWLLNPLPTTFLYLCNPLYIFKWNAISKTL